GGLVTDTQLMTARHVLGFLDANATECGAITVNFEANDDLAGDVDGDFNHYIPDANLNPYVPVDAENAITKSNFSEENPWLANRLFQLGLDVWAENTPRGRSRRQRLHNEWPFRAMFRNETNGA